MKAKRLGIRLIQDRREWTTEEEELLSDLWGNLRIEDIAQKLNTVGYMKELNRTQVGKFNIEDSITIDEFEKSYQIRYK